jgi:hypothetical protein
VSCLSRDRVDSGGCRVPMASVLTLWGVCFILKLR